MNNFPNIRLLPECPRCGCPKEFHGLVICLMCSRALKHAYDGGWGPWVGKLAVIEGGLEARKQGSTQP